MPTAAELRQKAAHCRRMMKHADPSTAASLKILADAYEADAAKEEGGSPKRPDTSE